MIKNNSKLVLVAFLLAPLFTAGIAVGGIPNAYAGQDLISVSMMCIADVANNEIDFSWMIVSDSLDTIEVEWDIESSGAFSEMGMASLDPGAAVDGSFSVFGNVAIASIEVNAFEMGIFIGSGSADAACVILSPPIIFVDIDIKPGSDPNSVNYKSRGLLPVAILTTDTFDATTVDPETVIFDIFLINGSTPPNKCAIEDVDGDGDLDLICHFSIPEIDHKCMGIVDGRVVHATGQILADTFDGLPIQGLDSIRWLHCPTIG
jgi:hypothetical protein